MKEITLTRGFVALVDDEDYERLNCHKWYTSHWHDHHCCYASRDERIGGRRKHIEMHRVITNAQGKESVDHINHDGLDNRRQNLRICTNAENIRNAKIQTGKKKTSKYKGVCWSSERRKWRSSIMINYHHIALGRFIREEDAAKTYDSAAIKYFGEFANTNFRRG